MSLTYLEKLNPEQRRAVEHGLADDTCIPAGPLLVIAGAGSGKTATIAHRVARPAGRAPACPPSAARRPACFRAS